MSHVVARRSTFVLFDDLRHHATVNDMAYHRKNHSFNARLVVRRDELKAATVARDEQGRVIVSALPYLTFPSTYCAEQFVRRVLLQREKPTSRVARQQ